jgi:hypothetical protein
MSKERNTGGVGILGFVFLIFLALKLGGWGIVATWSWWWVFSPLWIPIAILLFFLLILGIINAIG